MWSDIVWMLFYLMIVFTITTLPYTFLTKKMKRSKEKGLKEIAISYIRSVTFNIRPIAISLLTGFIIVSLLFSAHIDATIELPFSVPILGDNVNWIVCYTILSLPFLLMQALYIRHKMR